MPGSSGLQKQLPKEKNAADLTGRRRLSKNPGRRRRGRRPFDASPGVFLTANQSQSVYGGLVGRAKRKHPASQLNIPEGVQREDNDQEHNYGIHPVEHTLFFADHNMLAHQIPPSPSVIFLVIMFVVITSTKPIKDLIRPTAVAWLKLLVEYRPTRYT